MNNLFIFSFFCLAITLQLAQCNSLSFSNINKDGVTLKKDPNIDLCPTCLNFMDESLNTLLNIILNSGVIGSCSALCGELAQVTHSPLLGTVCSVICDVVGLDLFIHAIEKADLDPIYYCEIIDICPVFDQGDAEIISFNAFPKQATQGAVFNLNLAFRTINGTGTGQIDVGIKTVDHEPVGASFLSEMLKPGVYGQKIQVSTDPSGCDPSQGPCEQWLPGNYTAKIAICNGECGSRHPHSKIYAEQECTFTITGT
ncbi:hypothetical protein SNEBB_009690 [Seison nebaliae]|nr:hypothetical protein SNEBB_009690 [Seison nebaliae]